ncbi:MAG: 16S rRNA (cytidine(1402)-2'-O)-methyltransferase [Magnetococcales bacterium]|nr:16S rRNA (cytidine(1402)-2'-O)-methyltransferase [Magnetococcales bacterium]MBF0437853.1 16S rRNA (cytidine(1402)-2'-O)-methyltransferase [Magnetococcales bacterium]
MKDHAISDGRLYIIPTPIGNLEDMTFRAVRILGEVARILAEDTRRTRILCDRYGVKTPVVHFDDHNANRLIPGILAELAAGARFALVSDAGTPGISDPGVPLVRAAIQVVAVEALPGASAVTTALSGSGFACDRFVFEGFLPRRGSERRRRLDSMAQETRTVAFFESPQRLAATLADLVAVGAGERAVVVARELSKVFETLYRGSVAELAAHFHGEMVRGEIVVILNGGVFTPPSAEQVEELLDAALNEGMSIRDATRHLASRTGQSASELYKLALARRRVEE